MKVHNICIRTFSIINKAVAQKQRMIRASSLTNMGSPWKFQVKLLIFNNTYVAYYILSARFYPKNSKYIISIENHSYP